MDNIKVCNTSDDGSNPSLTFFSNFKFQIDLSFFFFNNIFLMTTNLTILDTNLRLNKNFQSELTKVFGFGYQRLEHLNKIFGTNFQKSTR